MPVAHLSSFGPCSFLCLRAHLCRWFFVRPFVCVIVSLILPLNSSLGLNFLIIHAASETLHDRVADLDVLLCVLQKRQCVLGKLFVLAREDKKIPR